ncbi:MAG: LPS export ABC transporter periplasmic protein LptC, partial [Bdellovibrionales bacterium]|nr:LPS export ABC transporter periplasmic protein LptC [Bdellovibrionales bacterium]
MKKLTQIVLFLFFIAIIAEVVIFVPKTLDQEDAEEPVEEQTHLHQGPVEQLLTEVHLVESREDEKEWELWSKEAKTYKKNKVWDLEVVHVKFFGKKGVVFDVTGAKGKVEIRSKNMEITGNVVTKTSNGYEFRTEKVIYNSKERILYGPLDIEMMGPPDALKQRMSLKGRDLVANLDTSLMEIKNNVA